MLGSVAKILYGPLHRSVYVSASVLRRRTLVVWGCSVVFETALEAGARRVVAV